ncbi:MAG: radical SAM protein [Coriobacteriia bacterium]|nr:radical SAM protein [Coriobacteriia bacterium]
MLSFADIALGTASGVPRCMRCHRPIDEHFRDPSGVATEIREVCQGWPGGSGPNIYLVGAEPLRHPALFELLHAAVESGAARIGLETDAHALASREISSRALRSGVRQLTVSVLGPNAERHDALSGRHGSYDQTVEGVRTFLDEAREGGVRVHLTFRVPVCRHNLREAPAIVTAACGFGAHAVILDVDDTDLDLNQASPWLEAACDTGVVNTTWVEVRGVPYGFARGWELHLASVYRLVSGDKAEACGDCALGSVCGGAVSGASATVLASLAPPPNATQVAERVSHGFGSPRSG